MGTSQHSGDHVFQGGVVISGSVSLPDSSITDDMLTAASITAAKRAAWKTGIDTIGGATAGGAGKLVMTLTNRFISKATDGVEALTLANGTAGQLLTIYLATDGGTGTLTPTICTGFSTIAFADAGDTATLQYVDDTTGWVIVGLAGFLGTVPVVAA